MIEKEELDRFIASCRDEQAELLMTLGRIPAPSHHEEKRAAFCKSGSSTRAATRCGSMKPKT